MRSVLALVVAIAMVAGAWYLRYGRDGAGGGVLQGSRGPVAVVCATELAAACDALEAEGAEVTVEDAGETAEALLGDTAVAADAWLVPTPWPSIVNDELERGGGVPVLDPHGEAIARSPGVIAIWEDRAAVLRTACNGVVDWTCIGRAAQGSWTDVGGERAWGLVKPSHDDPRRGVGVAVLGGMAADHLRKTKFNARDLDSEEFLRWFSPLEEAVPSFGAEGSPPFQQMVAVGRAQFDAVGTIEAHTAGLIAESPRAGEIEIIYPDPGVTADVVLAPLRGADDEERAVALVGRVVPAALAQAGWRVEGQPLAPGVDAGTNLPPQTEAPSAGALDALRRLWEEEQ